MPLNALFSTLISVISILFMCIDPFFTSYFSFPAIVLANVLFPDPFRPIIACTSPLGISKSIPFKISFSSIETCKFFILIIYPTLFSNVTSINCFASTANSIGSSSNTSLQNPLTIIETALSSLIPL